MLQLRVYAPREVREIIVSLSLHVSVSQIGLLCTPSLPKQPHTALQTERLMMYELYRHVCQRQTDNRNKNLKNVAGKCREAEWK